MVYLLYSSQMILSKNHLLLALLCTTLFFLKTPLCSGGALIKISEDAIPLLQDDDAGKNLSQAIAHSIDYLRALPSTSSLRLGERVISPQHMINTLLAVHRLIEQHLPQHLLQSRFNKYFDIFQATGLPNFNSKETMLVTGYYQPVVEGSLTKKAPYLYPLYAVPTDLIQRYDRKNTPQTGRLENGIFKKYWTRKEIETQHKAQGFELVWLKDPMDAFFIHVQGSAVIRLRSGRLRTLHFARKNGQPYSSIGRFMVKTGRISLKEASMETIRRYITKHPDERDLILHTNPSYIFFKWAKQPGAIGNIGQQLTPGRSIAADQYCFPPGGIAFLQTRYPKTEQNKSVAWKALHRFVLLQDSGSAIKGPGRVDLFWGAGEQAGLSAGMMKEPGKLFFFILKSDNTP